jgi:hypothetical protein
MLVLVERCERLSGPLSSSERATRVELLAEGVVSVEWKLPGTAEEAARVHVHAGDGTKLPVDLAFHERDGRYWVSRSCCRMKRCMNSTASVTAWSASTACQLPT